MAGENPDFVWQGLNGLVGLEVTRLFKGVQKGEQPMQVQEAEQRRVVQLAQEIFEQRNTTCLDVMFSFGWTNFSKHNRMEAARRFAEAVESIIPSPNSWTTLEDDSSGDLILSQVSRIRVARFDVLDENCWTVSSFGFSQTNFISELQQRIDEKNSELHRYLKRCAQCWLLVVADGEGASSFFNPSDETKSHRYNSGFDRTFFMDVAARRVLELICALSGD